MEAEEWDEIVELDPQRFVALHFLRRWPRYVVEWSVKQRAGESDFPLSSGESEHVPAPGEKVDDIWPQLRERAVHEAQEAAKTSAAVSPPQARGSWLSRLLGRDSS